jgi:hypothetical protein
MWFESLVEIVLLTLLIVAGLAVVGNLVLRD